MIQTSTTFASIANGTIRPLAQKTLISFTKQRNQSLSWFTLDQSVLDGSDILASNTDDAIQLWDAYDWSAYTDDVIKLDWSRSVQFPYNVQSATCDVTMNNTHQRYTYENSDSPLYGYILPKRPIRTYAGFKKSGTAEVIPIFVGLTQGMPTYSDSNNSTATFTALDFLSEIGNMQLSSTIMMRDVRTDEAIDAVLQAFGMDASMYSLDKGLNVIPFLDLESGENAGQVLQKLVQAENGALWLNENGIIRFAPRVADLGKTAVMTFDEQNIVSISPSRTDGIINRVKIESNIRKIQDFQPIFTLTNEKGYESIPSEDSYRISANGNVIIWASFEDPVWTANTPVFNGANDDSSFTAVDLSGDAVTSNMSISTDLFSNSMKITITNSNNYPVSVSYVQIWGEPAKIVDTIKYDAYDTDSVDEFGEMVLEINDNDYFGSYNNANDYAEYILKQRASYSPIMTLKVKGSPALQLGDIIQVNDKFVGTYKVIGIKSAMSGSDGLSIELTVEHFDLLTPFILDESELDGTDVLGG